MTHGAAGINLTMGSDGAATADVGDVVDLIVVEDSKLWQHEMMLKWILIVGCDADEVL
jgi:hypothetical protein